MDNQLNKKVDLLISGEEIGLDKTVLEKPTSPLLLKTTSLDAMEIDK